MYCIFRSIHLLLDLYTVLDFRKYDPTCFFSLTPFRRFNTSLHFPSNLNKIVRNKHILREPILSNFLLLLQSKEDHVPPVENVPSKIGEQNSFFSTLILREEGRRQRNTWKSSFIR